MNPKRSRLPLVLLGGAGLLLTAAAVRASVRGWTLAPPYEQPQSIREGSAKGPLRPGLYPTRYFVGGGLRGGK